MIEIFLWGLITFVLVPIVILFSHRKRHYRIEQPQWTKYDDNGDAIRGVGHRGYWTNTATFGGRPFPFELREDGCWYNIETGAKAETTSLSELLKREKDDS